LIIDKRGYLPMAGEAAVGMFQVITQRYLKGSILLTTNLGVPSWSRIFNDDPMVAARHARSSSAQVCRVQHQRRVLPDALTTRGRYREGLTARRCPAS
jgi:DNA replication protein DnaC